MRLKQYILNESDDEIIETLKRDCKPFLRESEGNFVYRGSFRKYDGLKKLSVKIDRKPTDTPPVLHKLWNDEFKKKFGWYVRSEGFFVTGDYHLASNFGTTVYVVFPIGQFKFVWSKNYKDLTNAIRYETFEYYLDMKYGHQSSLKKIWYKENSLQTSRTEYEEWKKLNIDRIDKEMRNEAIDLIKNYTDKDFSGAIESGHEISIQCDSYYAILEGNIKEFYL